MKHLIHFFFLATFAQQTVTLPPLLLQQAYTYADTQTIHLGVKAGEYDTTVTDSQTYFIINEGYTPPSISKCNPIQQIKDTRNYAYKTVCVGAFENQISDSILSENLDTLKARFERMDYAGTCVEHSQFSKRLLDSSFTVLIYTLKKDSGQKIDHVINLVYWQQNGKTYGVSFDALMGYVAPLKTDGTAFELDSIVGGEIDTPLNMLTKRYTIDSTFAFCNLYLTPNSDVYSNGEYLYHYYHDDINVLATQELIGDEMDRSVFLGKYSDVLADVLKRNKPQTIKQYNSCLPANRQRRVAQKMNFNILGQIVK